MTDDPKKHNDIKPGPCPIHHGVPNCPPPTEIDIIKVKKVFQECMHTQVEEVDIPFFRYKVYPGGAKCVSAEVVGEPQCHTISPGVVKVSFSLKTCTRLVSADGRPIAEQCDIRQIEKTFRLTRAGEKGLECQAHVFPKCLVCFIKESGYGDGPQAGQRGDCGENGDGPPPRRVIVRCCVGILILIKLEAEVQLLVPTYGYAPKPPECKEVKDQCPDTYTPSWPPYPQQSRPPIKKSEADADGGDKDCGCN